MTPHSLNDVPMKVLEGTKKITAADMKRIIDSEERGLVWLTESTSLPKRKRGRVHVLPGPINLDAVRQMLEAP